MCVYWNLKVFRKSEIVISVRYCILIDVYLYLDFIYDYFWFVI